MLSDLGILRLKVTGFFRRPFGKAVALPVPGCAGQIEETQTLLRFKIKEL